MRVSCRIVYLTLCNTRATFDVKPFIHHVVHVARAYLVCLIAIAGRYHFVRAASPPPSTRKFAEKSIVRLVGRVEHSTAGWQSSAPLHEGCGCPRRTVLLPMLRCIAGHQRLPPPGAEPVRARRRRLGTSSRVQDLTGSAMLQPVCESDTVGSRPSLLLYHVPEFIG